MKLNEMSYILRDDAIEQEIFLIDIEDDYICEDCQDSMCKANDNEQA